MYLCEENKKKIEEIINYIKSIKIKEFEDTMIFEHGSFAKCSSKYLSDVDLEYFVKNDKSTILAKGIYKFIIELMENKKIIFKECLIGMDDRFDFNFYLEKNGSIHNYNYIELMKKLDKLKKDKIINKEEYDNLKINLVENPLLNQAAKLLKDLEELGLMKWTLDEIKKGDHIYRKKKFNLKDILYGQKPVIITSIIEFDENKFVNFDLSLIFYDLKNKNIKIDEIYEGKSSDNYIILYNDPERNLGTTYIYFGIFTNYANKKYYKTIKRINTLLGSYVHLKYESISKIYEKGREFKYKYFLFDERKRIKEIFSTPLGLQNQIGHNIKITIYLLENNYDELLIKKQIINILNDFLSINLYDNLIKDIKDVISKEKLDKNILIDKLNELHKFNFNNLNEKAFNYLKQIYDRIKFLLPFRLEGL